MTRITLELLRRRSEHNDGLIHNLEELSLHQDNLEEIENIGLWCKDLKILYLQSNTISKIENLNRLKDLEYLNLAVNNIERIENLQGCESLRKLDLTANFIGDITSVENLHANYCLEELFLTGNPCASFDGYREYVIAALPQIKFLDGQEIMRTERIQAMRDFLQVKARVIKQQAIYKAKRDQEKAEILAKLSQLSEDCPDAAEWEKLPYSPEYRREMSRRRDEQLTECDRERAKSRKNLISSKEEKRPVPLYSSSGEPLNVNEARLDFSLNEDEENGQIVLDVAVFRHLDTSLIVVDVQPTFVKVIVKEKILQLRLPSEVFSDRSTVQRSNTTGNILITMPLVETGKPGRSSLSDLKPKKGSQELQQQPTQASKNAPHPFLEVDPGVRNAVNFRLVKNSTKSDRAASSWSSARSLEQPDSPGFVDREDVPPLR